MRKDGFTLIEILLVVGIIGLMGLFSAVAINSARSRMRDAKRVADVKQVQIALEDFFREQNRYPAWVNIRLGDPASATCLTDGGFAANCSGASQVFMPVVPAQFSKGVSRQIQCGTPASAGYCYRAVGEGGSYRLEFELERSIAEVGILKGPNCLIPELGIRSGVCP